VVSVDRQAFGPGCLGLVCGQLKERSGTNRITARVRYAASLDRYASVQVVILAHRKAVEESVGFVEAILQTESAGDLSEPD
jgi:hypothetical protein